MTVMALLAFTMRLVRGGEADMWDCLNGRADKFFSHGVGVR